jgi:hypothetical protein
MGGLMKSLEDILDDIAKLHIIRKHSPVQTAECPMGDPIWGGYCESDEQLRTRLKDLLKSNG